VTAIAKCPLPASKNSSNRVRQIGTGPVRILSVSDFVPAGGICAVSRGRKIEFLLRRDGDDHDAQCGRGCSRSSNVVIPFAAHAA